MKRLKYLISFGLSLLIFLAIGFTPADCVPENDKETCEVPHLNNNDDEIDYENCTYKGFPLHGKIKFVDNFPDIKIQIVENFPDLKVKMVENFPDDCGEWKVVENFPDIKVQIVDNFPDFKVKYVDSFPGKP